MRKSLASLRTRQTDNSALTARSTILFLAQGVRLTASSTFPQLLSDILNGLEAVIGELVLLLKK